MDMAKKSHGSQCFPINCTNYARTGRAEGLSFHVFPRYEHLTDGPEKAAKKELHNEWVRNCRRADRQPSKESKVCSAHFTPDCFETFTGYGRKKTTILKKNAVPTVFALPCHLTPKAPKPRSSKTAQAALQPLQEPESVSVSEPDLPEPESIPGTSSSSSAPTFTSPILDHSYSLVGVSPRKLKRQNEEIISKAENLQRIHRNAVRREKRAKLTCQAYMKELDKVNLLNTELREKLDTYKHLDADLFSRPSKDYNQDQRNFSLTLYLYSPKALEFLRPHLHLPHQRTISRWLQKFNAEPGIQAAMLQGLKEKHNADPINYTECAMMIDAMGIKKMVCYDPKTHRKVGWVDFGFGEQSEEEVLAKEALVIMVVGLKKNWKAPVAYYLTNGVDADMQQQLLLSCIYSCREVGLKIRTLTFDGASANVAMVKNLGCKLDITTDDMKTYFTTPESEEKIYIFFDGCHMLKLLRNTLHDTGPLRSPMGEFSFDTFKALQALQDSIGLRLANKLSTRQTVYQNLKMKVNLAAQTLSESVSKALQIVHELRVPGFQDCLPLAEYCIVANNAFDMLNSRANGQLGYKKPCRLSDLDELEQRKNDIQDYFRSLENNKGQLLVKSKSYASIPLPLLGFVHPSPDSRIRRMENWLRWLRRGA